MNQVVIDQPCAKLRGFLFNKPRAALSEDKGSGLNLG